jgi:regulator of nucleoside diphosphate kinase
MMNEQLPPIRIAANDFHLLRLAAMRAMEDRNPVGGFLVSELERADVIEAADPLRCVRLDNWVTFRADDGLLLDSRIPVLPENFRSSHLHVSILSPLGAALIGVPVGSRMPYVGVDGVSHVLTVESLEPPAGVISLQRHRVMKTAWRTDDNEPGPRGPTAA